MLTFENLLIRQSNKNKRLPSWKWHRAEFTISTIIKNTRDLSQVIIFVETDTKFVKKILLLFRANA